MGTDRDWERWGAGDPYFGVLSDEQFRGKVLTDQRKAEFFASGDQHVERVLREAGQAFGIDFKPSTVLDFGCGVGRLLIPFARVAAQVTGVDVSASMLDEARSNCVANGVTNVKLLGSDDALSEVHGRFDVVHSYIVMPHIPWSRGRTIIRSLAEKVSFGGILAIQVLVRSTASPLVRGLVRLRYAAPPVNWGRNVLRGRPIFEQAMQLHVYDLATIEADLTGLGFVCKGVDERTRDFIGRFVYAQRVR